MDHSPNSIAPRFTVALLLSLVLLATATAQQPAGTPAEDRERGIQLYKQRRCNGRHRGAAHGYQAEQE